VTLVSYTVRWAHTSLPTELYILWRQHSRCKLSPTSATAHYSSPDVNAIWLVAQCELSGYVTLVYRLEAVGRKFSQRPGNPATVGVVRWPLAGDTAGYRLRRAKLTPVYLISISLPRKPAYFRFRRFRGVTVATYTQTTPLRL